MIIKKDGFEYDSKKWSYHKTGRFSSYAPLHTKKKSPRTSLDTWGKTSVISIKCVISNQQFNKALQPSAPRDGGGGKGGESYLFIIIYYLLIPYP